MTWLKLLNMFVLQLFFIRLARVFTRQQDGSYKQTGWKILKWIAPFTGWSNQYKVMAKICKTPSGLK